MMGNPHEASNGGAYAIGQRQQKATFAGMTALIGVLALIADIVSVATPHWGNYKPIGAAFTQQGYYAQDSTGYFGPWQSCKYQAYYSSCYGSTYYQTTAWLSAAGVCAIISVLSLGLFCLFAVLHVSMQLQRREIMVKFKTAVFLKVVFAAVAVVGSILSVIFGAVHFSVGGRHTSLTLSLGVMYYIQIVLIFVTALLLILSYLSWRKAKSHPLNLVPKDHMPGAAYEVQGNGISMTRSSGAPYAPHGQPRYPNQPQPNYNMHTNYAQDYNNYTNNGGYTNNGFTSVSLSVPTTSSDHMPHQHAMPMQAIKPIQPVQGIPQSQPPLSLRPGVPVGGVSFAPGGKTGTGGAGYVSAQGQPVPSHGGSMESLNSTNSSNMSNFSFGSTISTGSAQGPLRSSLKKPKCKDKASISSESSSKRVRLSLGAEQTSV